MWVLPAFEIRPLISKLSVLFPLGQLDWKKKNPFDFELFQHEILKRTPFSINLCVVHWAHMGSIVTSGCLNSLRIVYFKTSPAFWFILLSQYLCMLDFCLSILQELRMKMATYRCLIPPSSFNYSADVI